MILSKRHNVLAMLGCLCSSASLVLLVVPFTPMSIDAVFKQFLIALNLFVFGLVLSLLGRLRADQMNGAGKGYARAGLIISVVAIALATVF